MTSSMSEFRHKRKNTSLISYLHNFNNEQRVKLLRRLLLFKEMMENGK